MVQVSCVLKFQPLLKVAATFTFTLLWGKGLGNFKISLLCVTNKSLATKPLAWEVTKAQKGCRQKDAQNYSWLLLWRADGLQPQQKDRKPNPLVNQWLLLLQTGLSKHMPEGRYGAGLKRRGLTPRSLRVGRTVSTNKRLEEQARKKWSHVRTSLTPVWCHSGRYPETAVAPGQLLSHTCFGVEVLHLIPVCQTKVQGTCSIPTLHMRYTDLYTDFSS